METALLKPFDVARRLHTTERSLMLWRKQGLGPAFVRMNSRTIRYRPEDVDAWLMTHRVNGDQNNVGQVRG